ncbi:hypothetical protein Tco_0046998 [Tanacetum coccineum]
MEEVEDNQRNKDFDEWPEVQEINDDDPIFEEASVEFLEELKYLEYVYHLEQEKNYMENQIVRESREEELIPQEPEKETPVFFGPQRNLNGPPMFLWNKDLFYLKHGNTEENNTIIYSALEKHMGKMSYRKKHYKVRSDPEEVYLNLKIIEVIRVKNEQGYGRDLMEEIVVKRADDKAYIFLESDYKYLNKNDIEYMYLFCLKREVDHKNGLLNSLIVFIRGCVIWERVHDYRLGIESYHIKISLTGPTLVIPCIETLKPYTITSDPFIRIVYDNNKKERRVMNIDELLKDLTQSDGDDNQINDRFKKDSRYHVVPHPLTGNYIPLLADLSFTGLDDSVYRPTANKTSASVSQVETSITQPSNTSVEMPRVESVRPRNKALLTTSMILENGGCGAFGGKY